ncbi:hypothetical protein BCN_1182 [Bacillus cereus NC7401]|nr:hypothetical protein BCN_1182 [Bacillus cereus NC7401]
MFFQFFYSCSSNAAPVVNSVHGQIKRRAFSFLFRRFFLHSVTSCDSICRVIKKRCTLLHLFLMTLPNFYPTLMGGLPIKVGLVRAD